MRFRKGNYKYQLKADEMIQLSFNTHLWVVHEYILLQDNVIIGLNGYAWDGCSGPTWDDETNYLAGLAHDMGYQLMGEKLIPMNLREAFDDELWKLCRANGMWKPRADAYHWAVRTFGAGPASKPEPEIIDIPSIFASPEVKVAP